MRLFRPIGPAILAAVFSLHTGCHSVPPRAQPVPSAAQAQTLAPSSANGAPADPTQIDEQELDRRVQAHAAFAAGVVSQLKEESDAALDYFSKAALADPENEDLTIDVARRRLQRKEFDQAVELLTRAAARPGVSGTILAYLGLTQAQLGRTDDAIATYREALRRMPSHLASAGMLAQLLAEKQRVDEAFAVLKTVSKQSSEDPRFWADLADLFQQQGVRTPAKAEVAKQEELAALDRARKLNPSDPRLLRRLADRYYDLNRLDESELLYKQVREQMPRDPFPAARLAELYLRRGKPKEATEQLIALERESPTDPLPPYYLGMLSLDERKPERAAELFERAVLLGPDFEPAYVDLASTLLTLDQPQQALATLEKRAVRFKPTFRTEYLSGLAAARLQKMDEAMTHFADAEIRAKADQPGLLDHRFYFQIGAALERGGRSEEATRYLLKALELKPDFADALNHLGYMWADRGENLQRAHTMIRKAVDLEPDNEAFLDSLGWVLFKLGRPAEALPWLEKSARLLEKPDPTIHEHLGDTLAALQRWTEAAEHYRQSLGLEKSDAVQKKLDALPK